MHHVETVPLLDLEGFTAPHGFTTRVGGVSSGPYASLNLGLSSGDDPEAVDRNRTILLHQLAESARPEPDGVVVIESVLSVSRRPGGGAPWPHHRSNMCRSSCFEFFLAMVAATPRRSHA